MERSSKLKTCSQALRKNMTKEENLLWYNFLRKCPLQFRRQYIIGNYIVDFYCHKAKLVVEIDGAEHYTDKNKKSDEFRTEVLEEYGLKVIRFTNRQVDNDFRSVCEFIDAAVKAFLREEGGPL